MSLNKMTPIGMQKQFPACENIKALRSNIDLTYVPLFNRTKFADNNLGDRTYKYWMQFRS